MAAIKSANVDTLELIPLLVEDTPRAHNKKRHFQRDALDKTDTGNDTQNNSDAKYMHKDDMERGHGTARDLSLQQQQAQQGEYLSSLWQPIVSLVGGNVPLRHTLVRQISGIDVTKQKPV